LAKIKIKMKKLLALLCLCSMFTMAKAQEKTVELSSFRKLIISPRIRVELIKGDRESLKLVYRGVAQDRINAQVSGQTLRVWLTNARINDNRRCGDGQWRSEYEGAEVTAYITYRELRSVAFRGEQQLTCQDTLQAKQFKLKIYGRSEVQLAGIHAQQLKVWLYGENRLRIDGGQADRQKFKAYGENRVAAVHLRGQDTKMVNYGENRIEVNAAKSLRITSFGETQVQYAGRPKVSRRLVFGSASVWNTSGER
jgi:hypothetical protein